MSAGALKAKLAIMCILFCGARSNAVDCTDDDIYDRVIRRGPFGIVEHHVTVFEWMTWPLHISLKHAVRGFRMSPHGVSPLRRFLVPFLRYTTTHPICLALTKYGSYACILYNLSSAAEPLNNLGIG